MMRFYLPLPHTTGIQRYAAPWTRKQRSGDCNNALFRVSQTQKYPKSFIMHYFYELTKFYSNVNEEQSFYSSMQVSNYVCLILPFSVVCYKKD